jgi:hypothetical protein
MYRRRPACKGHSLLMRVVQGMGAGGILLALWLLGGTAHAAFPAAPGDAATLTFTATIQSGTVPGDVLFWLCADAQADGTGCFEMLSQPDGSFVYQLATTTGTTYHHLEIAWTRGRAGEGTATPATAQPSASPGPTLPLHTLCPYPEFTVTGPKSFTCIVDATLFTTTPTPGIITPTPTHVPDGSDPSPVDRDTATLITGLQVIIGVGLVLLVILVSLLIWQRVGKRGR